MRLTCWTTGGKINCNCPYRVSVESATKSVTLPPLKLHWKSLPFRRPQQWEQPNSTVHPTGFKFRVQRISRVRLTFCPPAQQLFLSLASTKSAVPLSVPYQVPPRLRQFTVIPFFWHFLVKKMKSHKPSLSVSNRRLSQTVWGARVHQQLRSKCKWIHWFLPQVPAAALLMHRKIETNFPWLTNLLTTKY